MQGMDIVAQLMAISAVTAPKSRGENFVQTKILEGEDAARLAEAMRAHGERTGKKDFDRDSRGVAQSGSVLLIGLRDAQPLGLNCGACGYASCKGLAEAAKTEMDFKGPLCAFRLLDMGIALGSAVKTASLLNVDNRIMYRAGVMARSLGLINWDFAMGIPLSVTGKNIFFDR